MNIYYYNINEFHNPDGIKFLTSNRREQYKRLRHKDDKARCLAAGLLLHRFLNVTDDAQIITGSHGKPYLKDTQTFFNLSHSGDYVVLAVSDCEAGIDIEKIKPNRENVAKRFFTPGENDWLQPQNSEQSFFDIWTAKEAVMKATGLGLSLSPTAFSVLPVHNGPHFILDKTWHLYWHSLGSYSLCIASEKPQEEIHFIPVNYETLTEDH